MNTAHNHTGKECQDTQSNPDEILAGAGIKPTSNRILVLRELLRSKRPLSLMELDTLFDTLDKSSIFRVLTLLLDHGVVHAVEDGRGIVRYEICRGNHDSEADSDMHAHFYCTNCHEVYCFEKIPTPEVPVPEGFDVHSINYMLKGICPACKSKRK